MGLTVGAQAPQRPAAIRRHSTVLTGGAQVAPRSAETRPRSMAPMAGGLAPQRQQANAKQKRAGPAMTLQEAKSIARHLGLTLRHVRSGDYRVNFRDGNDTTAYYTNDLEDAVNAAVEMARKRELAAWPKPHPHCMSS